MPMTTTIKATPVSNENPAIALANTMLTVIDELAVLMGQEVDLLSFRKATEHNQLLKRKQQLTVDYRSGMKTLALQPDLFKQLPEQTRNALKGAAQKLADITERNGRHLRGAVIATQRLVKTFVDLVREEVVIKPGYSNAQASTVHPGNYETVCKPVVINQTA